MERGDRHGEPSEHSISRTPRLRRRHVDKKCRVASRRGDASMRSTVELMRPSDATTMSASPQPDRLWSVTDVADYLRVPVSSVYKMTGPKARLRIPHVRLSGRLRFRKADIDRWIKLLTVSNLDTLQKVAKATHARTKRYGIDSS